MSPWNHESGTIFWRGRTSLHTSITFDFPSGLLTAQYSTRQHACTPNLRHGSSIKLSCRRHWMSWGLGGLQQHTKLKITFNIFRRNRTVLVLYTVNLLECESHTLCCTSRENRVRCSVTQNAHISGALAQAHLFILCLVFF